MNDFCEAAKSKHKTEDLEEILRGLRRDAEPIHHGKEGMVYQISEVQTTLTKKFMFKN